MVDMRRTEDTSTGDSKERHSCIPESTSSILKTAGAKSGSREKQVAEFEIAGECPWRATTIESFLITGGRYTENEMDEIMDNRQKRNIVTEEIWLNYFNTYLYEHQMITRERYIKMRNEIRFCCERKLSDGKGRMWLFYKQT